MKEINPHLLEEYSPLDCGTGYEHRETVFPPCWIQTRGANNDMRGKGNRCFLIRWPILTLKAYLVTLEVCVLALKVYLVTLKGLCHEDFVDFWPKLSCN